MTLVLPIILVLGAVTMFIVGFVVPRKSRAVQTWIDERFFKGQRESGKAPGRLVPKALYESLKDSRKVLDKSAKAGRKTREAPKP
jgi:hypothetical protein